MSLVSPQFVRGLELLFDTQGFVSSPVTAFYSVPAELTLKFRACPPVAQALKDSSLSKLSDRCPLPSWDLASDQETAHLL